MISSLEYHGTKGTKFQLVLLSLLIGTLLRSLDLITSEHWTYGVLGLVTAYVLGDVGGKFAEAIKK